MTDPVRGGAGSCGSRSRRGGASGTAGCGGVPSQGVSCAGGGVKRVSSLADAVADVGNCGRCWQGVDGDGDLCARTNTSSGSILLCDPSGDGCYRGRVVGRGSGAAGAAGCLSVPNKGVSGICSYAPSDGWVKSAN